MYLYCEKDSVHDLNRVILKVKKSFVYKNGTFLTVNA